jgi:hypothetical protein
MKLYPLDGHCDLCRTQGDGSCRCGCKICVEIRKLKREAHDREVKEKREHLSKRS